MGNWEDVFRESAQPPGKTEQDRCANAESAIKSAIKASAKLNARDIKILNNRGLYGMVILGPGVRVATVSVSHFDAFRGTPQKWVPLSLVFRQAQHSEPSRGTQGLWPGLK